MDKGYFTFAIGQDYIRLAYALALSIKNTQKINNFCVAIGDKDQVPEQYKHVFDHIVKIKNVGLKYPMANVWQIWDLTPYKETIHVEADMIFTSKIDRWWDELQQHELFFTSKVKDYRGKIATSDFYRRHFAKKGLPNLYNGFYYFRYSKLAHKFFMKAKEVSARYKHYAKHFFTGTWYPETPTTDEIFGITAYLLDLDNVVYNPNYAVPYFTHMKVRLQDWKHAEAVDTIDWMRYLNTTISKNSVNVGNYVQQGPFHYQNKLFMKDQMIDIMKEIYNERRITQSN